MNDRPAPLLPNALLAIGFVVFVVVGILTVLVPELSGEDDPETNQGTTPAATSTSEDATE